MASSVPPPPRDHLGPSGPPQAEEKLAAGSVAECNLREVAGKRPAPREGRRRGSESRKPQDELTDVRARLKKWEKEFAEQHKRKPEQTDIRASPETYELYKKYSGLKRDAERAKLSQAAAKRKEATKCEQLREEEPSGHQGPDPRGGAGPIDRPTAKSINARKLDFEEDAGRKVGPGTFARLKRVRALDPAKREAQPPAEPSGAREVDTGRQAPQPAGAPTERCTAAVAIQPEIPLAERETQVLCNSLDSATSVGIFGCIGRSSLMSPSFASLLGGLRTSTLASSAGPQPDRDSVWAQVEQDMQEPAVAPARVPLEPPPHVPPTIQSSRSKPPVPPTGVPLAPPLHVQPPIQTSRSADEAQPNRDPAGVVSNQDDPWPPNRERDQAPEAVLRKAEGQHRQGDMGKTQGPDGRAPRPVPVKKKQSRAGARAKKPAAQSPMDEAQLPGPGGDLAVPSGEPTGRPQARRSSRIKAVPEGHSREAGRAGESDSDSDMGGDSDWSARSEGEEEKASAAAAGGSCAAATAVAEEKAPAPAAKRARKGEKKDMPAGQQAAAGGSRKRGPNKQKPDMPNPCTAGREPGEGVPTGPPGTGGGGEKQGAKAPRQKAMAPGRGAKPQAAGASASWGNSDALLKMQKEHRAQQAREARARKKAGGGQTAAQRRKGPVSGRDNFVKVNMKRRFVNGTKTKAGSRGGWQGSQQFKRKGWKRSKAGAGKKEASSNPGGACADEAWLHQSGRAAPTAGAPSAQPDNGETAGAEGTAPEAVAQEEERIRVAEALMPLSREAAANPCAESLRAVLEAGFGFSTFRPGQLEVLVNVVKRKPTLVVLPTGAGKSLCYQLPALILPGMVLVVSPLVSLMHDQLARLPPCLTGALLSSGQSSLEGESTIRLLREGRVKVLFVSPERLSSDSFLRLLLSLPLPISLVAVDEAHCVAEWSHNFRPSYLRLGPLLQERLGSPPLLAMTATATRRTEAGLLRALKICPQGVVRQAPVRRNLTLTVSACQDRTKALLALLVSPAFCRIKSVIVYCSFQWEADDVARLLRDHRVNARSYHSGLNPDQRARIYKQFCANKLKVVVATVAFGMGLDKADVGAVVHHGMPKSLEQYVQEVGRAGRDGRPARCHLLLEPSNFLKLHSLAHSDGVDLAAIRRFLGLVLVEREAEGNGAGKGEAQENGGGVGQAGGLRAQDGAAVWRAFPKDMISKQLDVKPEALSTMLAFWEADGCVTHGPILRVLPDMRTTCVVTFYKTQPQALAARHRLVACILELAVHRNGAYTLDLVALATRLQTPPPDLFRHLLALQRAGEFQCSFSEEALCVEVLVAGGALSEGALDSLARDAWQRLGAVQRAGTDKLETMYRTAAAAVALAEPGPCQGAEGGGAGSGDTPEAPEAPEAPVPQAQGEAEQPKEAAAREPAGERPQPAKKKKQGSAATAEEGGEGTAEAVAEAQARALEEKQSELIQKCIEEYFESEEGVTTLQGEACKLPHKTESRFLKTDIKVFLHSQGERREELSARAIARILHSLSSPSFPYSEWSKNHFWGRYMDVPFPIVLKAAEEVLAPSPQLKKE